VRDEFLPVFAKLGLASLAELVSVKNLAQCPRGCDDQSAGHTLVSWASPTKTQLITLAQFHPLLEGDAS